LGVVYQWRGLLWPSSGSIRLPKWGVLIVVAGEI
jgi:hypothetical protein